MTIGVDLRIFQIGHQYRGIGAHISNLFREFSSMEELPNFVFFEHPNVDSGIPTIKKYLANITYEVRYTSNRLIGETYLQREWASFRSRNIVGDAGLGDLSGIDVLLSIDFNLGVPRTNKVRTVLISYDMIPWVLSENYLPNFRETFKTTKNFNASIKAAIDKSLYFHKYKQANKRAFSILAISEHTKKDIVRYLHIDQEKIETVLLGIDKTKTHKQKTSITCKNIEDSEVNFKTDNGNNPYVFFMGGADRRRRIEDLVQAFDIHAKYNPDAHLLLAGYDFQALQSIPDKTTRDAITHSTYSNRILFAGFVDDSERSALFTHAQAFVFPSIYEGFGLPILEAMNLHCPVITYNNSSIKEVGGNAVLYADSPDTIAMHIKSLGDDAKLRTQLISKGRKQVQAFSWEKTAQQTLEVLLHTASQ